MQAIRRGWYLGKKSSRKSFKDRLLKLLEKASQTTGVTRNRTSQVQREHGEAEAERIVRSAVKILGLPATAVALTKLPKSDGRKVALAALLRDRTSVGNPWIATRLAMGHPGSVTRMIGTCRKPGELASSMKRLAKALDDVWKVI